MNEYCQIFLQDSIPLASLPFRHLRLYAALSIIFPYTAIIMSAIGTLVFWIIIIDPTAAITITAGSA